MGMAEPVLHAVKYQPCIFFPKEEATNDNLMQEKKQLLI